METRAGARSDEGAKRLPTDPPVVVQRLAPPCPPPKPTHRITIPLAKEEERCSRNIAIPHADEEMKEPNSPSSRECTAMPLSPADSEARTLLSVLTHAANDSGVARGLGGYKVSAIRAVVNPKRVINAKVRDGVRGGEGGGWLE